MTDAEAPVVLAIPVQTDADVRLAAAMSRRMATNAGIGVAAAADIAEATAAIGTAMVATATGCELELTIEGRGKIARIRATGRQTSAPQMVDPGHRRAWTRGLCELDGPVVHTMGPGVEAALRLMDSVRVQRTEAGQIELVAVRLQHPAQTSRDTPRIVGYRVVGGGTVRASC